MTEQKPNKSSYPTAEAVLIDQMLEPDRHLWGLPEIAQVAGVSVDTVRRWHRSTDAPITKPGGRYFTTRAALKSWLCAR